MDRRPIGVFDSGMGGLTAVRELIHLMPEEDIVYFGDTGRVPYGSRSRDTIIKYARQVAAMLKKRDGLNSPDHVGTRRYFASDSAADFAALASIFLGRDITGAVEQVDITKY